MNHNKKAMGMNHNKRPWMNHNKKARTGPEEPLPTHHQRGLDAFDRLAVVRRALILWYAGQVGHRLLELRH